ncbi:MAG: GTPase Era [Anaerolineales bacterium]|jgi:GTPase
MENQAKSPFTSGFVAVMGRPNVGKSTLINSLMGQKIAAVSPKPQTTRKRQLGILTLPDTQIIFVDTPGIHQPRHKLGESMNKQAREALEASDLILFLVDASQRPTDEDRILIDLLHEMKGKVPTILAFNKIDQVEMEILGQNEQEFLSQMPEVIPLRISATRGDNLGILIDLIRMRLPKSQALYPEGQVTDLYERDIASDLIREAALINLRDEIPHGITVRIDEFTERNEHGAYIAATIFVERESHKPIVIGQSGGMLKKIGSSARAEIEKMSGRKVFLQLKVKVRKNWRNNEKILRWFGY